MALGQAIPAPTISAAHAPLGGQSPPAASPSTAAGDAVERSSTLATPATAPPTVAPTSPRGGNPPTATPTSPPCGQATPASIGAFLVRVSALSALDHMPDKRARRSPLLPRVTHAWSLTHLHAALQLAALPLARCTTTRQHITTPLRVGAWLRQLWQTGYDPTLAGFIVRCLRLGVPLGYTGPTNVQQHCTNLKSADAFPDAITAAVEKEVGTGRQLGPYRTPPFAGYRLSPLGSVDKKVPLGCEGDPLRAKRRKIHHLSWPAGSSVNDLLERRTVALSSFDAIVDLVRHAGNGCLIAKLDIGSAYRNIPVRPEDWPLLGFEWQHFYYWDTVLPFGLASSSLLFEVFALAARHVINARVTLAVTDNYADDYVQVTTAALGVERAQRSLQQTVALLSDELGLPTPAAKIEQPSTVMLVLGLLIDSDRMEVRLDSQRLADLQRTVEHWQQLRAYTRKQLEKLIGLLMFACTAIPPGRIFLHRMLALLRAIPRRNASPDTPLAAMRQGAPPVRSLAADSDMTRDLAWWHSHLATWNGTSLIREPRWTDTITLRLTTDACLVGYGACYGNEWFQGRWTDDDLVRARREQRESMPYLELLALLYAAATWGHHWSRKRILFLCDCDPVVQALTRHSSDLPETQQLERTLIWLAATHQFDYRVEHIAGANNVIADALSRFDEQAFRACQPSANRSPTIRVPLPTRTW